MLDKPLVDSENRVNTFRLGQQSTVFPTAPRGLVFPGDSWESQAQPTRRTRTTLVQVLVLPGTSVGNGKLALRAGYGLYYDTVISETTLQFLTAEPFAIQPFSVCTTIDNPYTNPDFGDICSPSIAQPFPFTPAKPGDPFDFAALGTMSLTINEPDFKTPYSHQYNMNVQWEFMIELHA
jgi:hypothetical protein